MLIAITTIAPRLDSALADGFENAPYFLVIDTACPSDFQVIVNPNRTTAPDGGILAVSTLINLGAEAMITCRCTEAAERVFSAADVPVYEAVGVTPRKIIVDLLAGKLHRRPDPQHHHQPQSGGR